MPDPRRIIGNIVQLGTIESVNLGEATCRVRVGQIVTGDIPWVVQRAGGTRTWSPPTIGEQCILICPEGDTESGFAILGVFSDANPAPSDQDIDLIRYADGATISYDANNHALVAVLAAGGTAAVTAPGGITITGDVTVTGTLTATTDVVGAGVSLKNHKHGGVQAGGAQTGAPA